MRNSITQATKRVEFQQLVRSVAIGCTMVFSSQWSVWGQEATCGCEVQVSKCDGSCSKSKKPKQPSIAQQFLKQFDRIGDEIEAQSQFKSSMIRKSNSNAPTCGAEHQGPSCGSEFVEPACRCTTPAGAEMTRPTPLYQHESPMFHTETPASPIKKKPPVTPMHPQASPSQQALGKIKDIPETTTIPVRRQEPSSLQEPVRMKTPAPLAEAPAQLQKTPVAQPEPPAAMPKQVQEPFTPRLPKVSPKTVEPSALPSLNRPAPTNLPSLPGVLQGAPSPGGSTDLPQSQDEIPDVLVDPFKDDVSWRSRRDQMNGVLQTGGSVQERGGASTTLAAPIRLKTIPVQETEETPTSVISIGPSFDSSESTVVASSHIERVPVRVHTVKRFVSASQDEMTPVVNRTLVPTRK